MWALVVLLVVLVAALGVANMRLRARAEELAGVVRARDGEIVQHTGSLAAANRRIADLARARDDATTKLERSKHEAMEVAQRLRDETAQRIKAETERQDLVKERERAGSALDDAEGRLASVDDDRERLWALALARSERLWRTSVAIGPDQPSPFEDTDDPLHCAAQVEVEAAREEVGAAIELSWTGEPVTDPGRAVLVLGLVEALVAAVAKEASRATITVSSVPESTDVHIHAIGDDDEPVKISVAGVGATEPGRYRICG